MRIMRIVPLWKAVEQGERRTLFSCLYVQNFSTMNNQTTNPESETVSSKLNCEYSVNIETIRHLMGTIEAVQVNFKSYQRYKGTEFEQIAERDLKDIIAELQHFGVSLALNIL